ncbi:AAA family ATPase [Chloroflexota bacterium]
MVMNLQQLMTKDTQVRWLLEDFLPKGCIAFLHGQTGVKRSFYLQQLAFALATGKEFLGHKVSKPTRVLLYQQELTHAQMKMRAKKMLLKYPEENENLLFNKNYGLHLDTEDGINQLIILMDENEVEVVLLDPLYMLHSSDNKAEKDMMRWLNPLQQHAIETDRTIIVAAHSTKPNDKNRSGISSLAGTAALGQISAYVWSLSPELRYTNTGKLNFEKTRDMPAPKPLDIKFDPNTFTFERKGSQTNVLQLRVAWLQRETQTSLMTYTEAKDAVMEEFSCKETTAKAVLKEYREQGGEFLEPSQS